MSLYNHQFTNSSMLASASWDSNSKEMVIEFNNGRTYTYENVDMDIYNNLIDAKSAGAYFNSIKKDLKVKK